MLIIVRAIMKGMIPVALNGISIFLRSGHRKEDIWWIAIRSILLRLVKEYVSHLLLVIKLKIPAV